MMVVLPAWIDQAPAVDFAPERALMKQLEDWADENKWKISDGSALPHELRQRTDVLFVSPNGEDRIRLAVLPKAPKGAGAIRLDSSTLRTLELVYSPNKKTWRVYAGGVPIEDDVERRSWS